MYVVELQFECFENTTVSAVERAIYGVIEAFRFNGQLLGREFPVVMNDGVFTVRAMCPEKQSLHPDYHSDFVRVCLSRLTDAGLLAPKMKVIGQDIHSEQTDTAENRSWQILYTTYVHTCSPLRNGDTLLPVPLYRLPPTLNGDHKALIKWQTEWQACDELQMAGGCRAEFAALNELNNPKSDLFRRGWDLRGRIEYLTSIPTYYYQYQVGGTSLRAEQERRCPVCGGEWRLPEPAHDIFHFRCDHCRIVSNLSWDYLK